MRNRVYESLDREGIRNSEGDLKISRLDKGLDEAHAEGWTVVNMKNDWKVVYPFELNK